MLQITYTGEIEIINDAIEDAIYILNNEEFHTLLKAKTNFDNSNASGAIISDLIKESYIHAKIELYKPIPLPPWSRANAYTNPSDPTTVFLNKRKLNRSVESIAATIVHEFVHLVDFSTEIYNFGHGDNSNDKKENTAPYWIDICAYELLSGKNGKVVYQHDEVN